MLSNHREIPYHVHYVRHQARIGGEIPSANAWRDFFNYSLVFFFLSLFRVTISKRFLQTYTVRINVNTVVLFVVNQPNGARGTHRKKKHRGDDTTAAVAKNYENSHDCVSEILGRVNILLSKPVVTYVSRSDVIIKILVLFSVAL